MKRETTVFTRVNIHLIISLGNVHMVTLGVTCHLYKWSDGTRLTKTKCAREPCSHAAGRIQGYKLSSYLLANPIDSKFCLSASYISET
jgi:hypothetical protein